MTDSPSGLASNDSSTPVSSKVDTAQALQKAWSDASEQQQFLSTWRGNLQYFEPEACDENLLPTTEPTDPENETHLSDMVKQTQGWDEVTLRQFQFELDRMARDEKMIESQKFAKHLAPFPYQSKH